MFKENSKQVRMSVIENEQSLNELVQEQLQKPQNEKKRNYVVEAQKLNKK